MTTKSIGIFAFGTSPIAHMAPLRTRALLGEAALQDVELFFFSAADCDMPRREIEATYWTSSGWAKRRAPLPGLVLVVTDPIRPRHHEIDQWLRGHSRVIADHAPDKLELGRFLLGTPLAGYVIPCAPLDAEGAETAIAGWASEHGAAIVKPIDGMRGGGIHFIGKGDDGRWLAAVGEERTEGTLAEAANWIVERISGRMGYRRYLVQQYIRSTTAEGRPAALRADVQKKPEGGWGLIRGVVRFGEVDRFITNMARGGYQGPPDGFLSRRRVRPAAETGRGVRLGRSANGRASRRERSGIDRGARRRFRHRSQRQALAHRSERATRQPGNRSRPGDRPDSLSPDLGRLKPPAPASRPDGFAETRQDRREVTAERRRLDGPMNLDARKRTGDDARQASHVGR